MARRKTKQSAKEAASSGDNGCMPLLRKYARYTIMLFGACCIFTIIIAIFAPESDEPAVPTLMVLPSATATEVIPTETHTPVAEVLPTDTPPTVESANAASTETENTSTPAIAPDNQAVSNLTFTRRNGFSYTVQSIMIIDKSSINLSGGDIILVVLAEIDAQNSRRDCVYANDIRLYLDGNEYRPQGDIMSRIQELILPDVDFTGAFSGHCIEAGQVIKTFSAFEVPLSVDSALLSFDDDERSLKMPWIVSDYPKQTDLDIADLPLLATQIFDQHSTEIVYAVETAKAQETQAVYATMTATLWTDTPTPTTTNTPLLTNTVLPSRTPQPTVRAVSTTMYASNGSVRVRSCPDANNSACGVVDVLSRGDSITVYETVQGSVYSGSTLWYRAEYNGREVYVHSELVQSSPPPAPTAVPVQSSGSTNSGSSVNLPPVPSTGGYSCDCSRTCTRDIVTCEEAYFQLNQCGCSRRDDDKDGVPCENLCSGG